MKLKEQLLQTKMHQLGLPKSVSRYFFNPRDIKEEDVITLQEFIKMNHEILGNKDPFFISKAHKEHFLNNYNSRNCFDKRSATWTKIKTFLLENGFTYKDCVHLLPGGRRDMSLLSKKQILSLPMRNLNMEYYTFQILRQYITKVDDVDRNDFSVFKEYENAKRNYNQSFHCTPIAELMVLNGSDIQMIMKEEEPDRRRFRLVLHNAQRKLKSWGFTKTDGKFMGLYLYPTCHTKDEFVTYLTTEKSFSKKQALTALKLGKRAGWVWYND